MAQYNDQTIGFRNLVEGAPDGFRLFVVRALSVEAGGIGSEPGIVHFGLLGVERRFAPPLDSA
jgi:hypothetical protein